MSGNMVKLNKEQYIEYLAEKEVMKEINASIQSFNYNLNSLQSTNGQAPFVTLWMRLGEARTESERADLAMLIEEFLFQRIQGMKNKDGVYITIAFPKLVLCLDEHLMSDEYKYLRKIAAECSSKRLVPDYVSEKIMLREKIGKNGEGDAYPPMGCLDHDEQITIDGTDVKIGELAEAFKLLRNNKNVIEEFKSSNLKEITLC